MKRDTALSQYFMPVWAAELIVKRKFNYLGEKDTVVDIGCGDGRFLMAIPEEVNAYGIEIDPILVKEARINTGRKVIEGDATNIVFPEKPTLIIGNPPFDMAIVNGVIDQAYEALDYGNEVRFVLPVYSKQQQLLWSTVKDGHYIMTSYQGTCLKVCRSHSCSPGL